MVKKFENHKIFKKNSKNHLFQKYEKIWNISFLPEKNAIPLVLPIEEIILWSELSSPSRFRIQGFTLSVAKDKVRTEILVSSFGYWAGTNPVNLNDQKNFA